MTRISTENKSRLLVMLVAMPSLILILLNQKAILIATMIILLICTIEIFRHIYKSAKLMLAVIFTMISMILLNQINSNFFLMFNLLSVPLLIILLLNSNVKKYTVSLTSFFYITILGSNLIFLILQSDSINIILLILIVSFTSDSFAYLIGKKIGKSNLSIRFSKNKTWEGAIGGYIFGLLSCFICVYIFNFEKHLSILILTVFFLPIACQIGDIMGSILKRKINIKDFSQLLFSHGGFMDRLDSITVTALVFNLLFFWQ
ncbi:MAG: phosphatidate cytidylyltransferase [Dehalococcoidia bacterium]